MREEKNVLFGAEIKEKLIEGVSKTSITVNIKINRWL